MITTLIFKEGERRLEIECPDGHIARAFLARVQGHESHGARAQVKREISVTHGVVGHDRVLEIFNCDDDKFMRDMRDRANVKIVHVPDPGSVAGRYHE